MAPRPRSTVHAETPSSGRIRRRTLLAALGGLVLGGAIGTSAALRLGRAASVDDDGLPLALVEVGDAREIADRLEDGGVVRVPEDGNRVAVVRWDPSHVSELGSAMERYGHDGEGHPVLDDRAGLMALSPYSTHLGCAAPFCESSGWFEDPCHGSRWNTWGEWTGGPAPRGLDRYRSHVREDGVLVVDLTRHISGPRREAGILEQRPQGPHCVGG